MGIRLRKWLKYALSYIPQQLPQTEVSCEAWCSELLEVAGLPDNPSIRIAIYSMILHLGAGTVKASKQGFIKQVRRSIANQASYNLMDALKTQQQEKKRDEQKRAEEAASQVVQETST